MVRIAGAIVAGAGLFLIGLGLMIALRPTLAERFLRSYASLLRAHMTEQSLRLVAGLGFIGFGGQMRAGPLFSACGWVLVVTSAILLGVPWRWHNRFGQWVIPIALRHKRLYAIGALALGTLILASMPWPTAGST